MSEVVKDDKKAQADNKAAAENAFCKA